MLDSMIPRVGPIVAALLAVTPVHANPQRSFVGTTLSSTTSSTTTTDTISSTTHGSVDTTISNTPSIDDAIGGTTDTATLATAGPTATVSIAGSPEVVVVSTTQSHSSITTSPPAPSFPTTTLVALDTPRLMPGTACNNSPLLCNRRYHEITYLGAHNSPFLRNLGTGFSLVGSQYFNAVQSLSAGVRLLHAEVHLADGNLTLCNTDCNVMRAGILSDWLLSMKGWLDANQAEVVTLILVNKDAANILLFRQALVQADLIGLSYTPPFPAASHSAVWPTLAEMIYNNTRLVIFVDNYNHALDGCVSENTPCPYILDEWNYVFETPPETISPNFICDLHRPATWPYTSTVGALNRAMLPLLNHIRHTPVAEVASLPDEVGIDDINSPSEGNQQPGTLGHHAKRCEEEWERKPVFVMVDFWNRGPALEVVDRMNGVRGSVTGRTDPPPEDVRPDVDTRSGASTTFTFTSADAARARCFALLVLVETLF